jgi:tetratricopeptide (TPR) repeat protein
MNFQVERLKQLPHRPAQRWQGAMFRSPSWVKNGVKKPYRPWSAMWVCASTQMASLPAMIPREQPDFALALDNLVSFACDKEVAGYRPGTLEVRDALLASYLREKLVGTGIDVEHREKLIVFDEVYNDLVKHLCKGDPLPDALSAKRVTVEMMRSFADAAAEFYTAGLWRYLCDVDLIRIESPVVDPLLRYACILGHAGITYGIAFYDSAAMFEQFSAGHGMEIVKRQPYWTLFFGGIEELPLGDADLWEDSRLPVASEQAYPLAMCFVPKGKYRRPQPDVLAFMEGLLRCLAQTSEAELDSGRWQKTVPTLDGDMTLTLALPELLESAEDARRRNMESGYLPDRRALEKTHLDVHRILEGHEFSSTDEINAFLNANLNGKPIPQQYPVTPLEQAQDLCYDAVETRGRKQLQLARKALEICPDCVDAYVLLAEASADVNEAHELYAKGVAAGERLLGGVFFKEEAGHFWGIVQTRPYMRARFGLAQTLEHLERFDEAILHYQDMLRLDPNDNQGVREVLLPCLLLTHRTDEAKILLNTYKESGAATWSYGRALLTFMQKGDSTMARKYLANAIKANRFTPDYLLGEGLLLPAPQNYRLGSKEEAIVCAEIMQKVWQTIPGALDWLEHTFLSKKRLK